ncbi:hypothetical protein [Pseudomonas syringae]|uniref:hypothetical protein n=1 Tax=Pseudomonas syringae TaxID=317 RepID=UPI001CAA23A9|nr:hypothetical protein [Pseudomonas syringae]
MKILEQEKKETALIAPHAGVNPVAAHTSDLRQARTFDDTHGNTGTLSNDQIGK